MSRHNILVEFDVTHTKLDLHERLWSICEKNWAFLAGYQREGDLIRILSEYGEIKQMMFKEFDQFELDLLMFRIVRDDEQTQEEKTGALTA